MNLFDTQPTEGTPDVREYVARKPSVRPPGAGAPVIPGFSSSPYDESSLLDMYADDPQKSYSGHRQQDPDQLRHSDPFSQPVLRYHTGDVYNEAPTSSRINDNQSSSSSDPHPHCKYLPVGIPKPYSSTQTKTWMRLLDVRSLRDQLPRLWLQKSSQGVQQAALLRQRTTALGP